MSTFTAAHEMALRMMTAEKAPAGRPDDFDRLVEIYGYDAASEGWRAACEDIDRWAEDEHADHPLCT